MNQQPPLIDMAPLKRSESLYRVRLSNEPGDSGARIKLAWCLFMQALYRAGQESMVTALASNAEEEKNQLLRTKCIWDQSSNDLIQDCLKQTSAVMHLSRNAKDRADATRLQSLIKQSGAEQAVAKSKEDSSRLFGEVLHEIL